MLKKMYQQILNFDAFIQPPNQILIVYHILWLGKIKLWKKKKKEKIYILGRSIPIPTYILEDQF